MRIFGKNPVLGSDFRNHFILLLMLGASVTLTVCLASMTHATSDVSTLLKALKHNNAKIREDTARELSVIKPEQLGEKRPEVVLALQELLKDKSEVVRFQAAETLAYLHSSDKEVVAILIQALKRGRPYYDLGASMALGAIGPEANEAVPAIIETMHRYRRQEHFWSGPGLDDDWVTVLEEIGTPEAQAVIESVKQKKEMQKKLVQPISILSDNSLGSSFVALGFMWLFWWSRSLRKTGKTIMCWPILIPIVLWGSMAGVNIVDTLSRMRGATQGINPFNFQSYLIIAAVTLVGLVPWALSWLRLRRGKDTVESR